MQEQIEKRRDLLLLLSLLFVILMHPILDHGTTSAVAPRDPELLFRVLATIRMSERRRLGWPFVLLISAP